MARVYAEDARLTAVKAEKVARDSIINCEKKEVSDAAWEAFQLAGKKAWDLGVKTLVAEKRAKGQPLGNSHLSQICQSVLLTLLQARRLGRSQSLPAPARIHSFQNQSLEVDLLRSLLSQKYPSLRALFTNEAHSLQTHPTQEHHSLHASPDQAPHVQSSPARPRSSAERSPNPPRDSVTHFTHH